MPKRKKQVNFEEEEIDPYYYNGGGSLEYGMDDYDDPTEHMTPAELKALAQYISMMKGGGAGNRMDEDDDDDDDDDDSINPYIPPGPLYPPEDEEYDEDDEE